jgi:hypothetical protein
MIPEASRATFLHRPSTAHDDPPMSQRAARMSLQDRVVRRSEQIRRVPLEPVCFALVAGIYAAHLFLSGYDRFYWDSSEYWDLGKLFGTDGHFSLLSFNYPDRGYFLPLLNRGLQEVASGLALGSVTIVKLFGALLAATLGVLVLPRLARRLFPHAAVSWGRVLALNGLLFLYWRDHFDFPLSDFPALLATCVGLLGLLRGGRAGYVVAGLGLALGVNMRPEYLPAFVIAVGVVALVPLRSWDWRRRGTAVALVLAGALVASLPQILINHRHRDSWSPIPAGSRHTAMRQLTFGLFAQKYETYVGGTAGYPQPGVFYLDPAAQHVMRQEGVPEITSYGQYARIVVHHPFELAASYVRHIFNGLDVRYPTPYIRNLRDSSILLSLFQYTLIFLALARLVVPEARRALGRIRWAGILVLVSPCLSAIPGAVEPRFFLPAQVLIYMLVCFGPDQRAWLLVGGKGRRVGLAASYAAFLLVCVTLSSATQAQLQHPGPTLGIGEPLNRASLIAD